MLMRADRADRADRTDRKALGQAMMNRWTVLFWFLKLGLTVVLGSNEGSGVKRWASRQIISMIRFSMEGAYASLSRDWFRFAA